jgi:AcrR family transcriptional regulator
MRSAVAASESTLMSASRICLPTPVRRAMAWPIAPAQLRQAPLWSQETVPFFDYSMVRRQKADTGHPFRDNRSSGNGYRLSSSCYAVGMTRATSRTLRKDAELNRQRLLAAAVDLFAKRGLHVTLNDIAHHAGVGIGTAYRRFANKEQVIDALLGQRLDEVAARANEALADPDAWRGLTTFLELSLRMQVEDRGLTEILNNPQLGQHRVNESRNRIAPLINAMVDRAKEQGALRGDFEGTDAIFIQVALAAVIDKTRGISPALYRRYLTMFLDGIRANQRPLSELPVQALTVDQTHRVIAPDQPRHISPATDYDQFAPIRKESS